MLKSGRTAELAELCETGYQQCEYNTKVEHGLTSLQYMPGAKGAMCALAIERVRQRPNIEKEILWDWNMFVCVVVIVNGW
jgi:hypothetical protein